MSLICRQVVDHNTPRGKPTSEFQRGQIIALHQLKLPSRRVISKQLKIPKSTINDIIKKYKKNKSVTDEPQLKQEDRSPVLKSIRGRKIYGRRKMMSWLPQVQ